MQRIPEVDGLRAVAVGLVFTAHAIPQIVSGGWVGVDLFFVISGFVITRSLMSDPSWSNFYLRRIRRILPALLVTCLGAALLGAKQFDVLATALSFMNWARAFHYTDGGLLGHAWSLSIEEQFYLVWPALFLFVRRPVPFLVAYILFVFAWRLTFTDELRIYNGLDTHSDGLALGCLLAFVGNRFPRWSWPIPALAILAILVVGPRFSIGIPIASLAAFWAISIASEHRFSILRTPLFQWGGSRSYSLYLWHYPIFVTVLESGMQGRYAVPLALIATLVAAELSYRFVERPFLRNRKADMAVNSSTGERSDRTLKPS